MTSETRVRNPDYASMADAPDSDDPFAVVYVVNDSRDNEGNIAAERDILQASSKALAQILHSEDEQIIALVQEWTSNRIRKIVKRARASAWNKVASLDTPHFMGEHNGVQVLAFAPMRVSAQPKELKKLQVTGLHSTDSSAMENGNEAHLLVKVNDSLNMTTGKVVAQVGHAVQLFLTYGKSEEVADWMQTGALLKVVRAKNISEDGNADIIVHDAGFTEVPSGSLTATAEYRFKLEGK